MNKQLKAKWVKALRSGKYLQGIEALRDETDRRNIKYCCLGVLCEIAPDTAVAQARAAVDSPDEYLTIESATHIFGVEGHSIQKHLADMNDTEVPFEVIAGFVEENL